MCKEGWCVKLGLKEVAEGGGNYPKYLKRGWNRKEGRGNKDFKKGNKLGQGVGALKRRRGGGLEPPYKLCYLIYINNSGSGVFWDNAYYCFGNNYTKLKESILTFHFFSVDIKLSPVFNHGSL